MILHGRGMMPATQLQTNNSKIYWRISTPCDNLTRNFAKDGSTMTGAISTAAGAVSSPVIYLRPRRRELLQCRDGGDCFIWQRWPE